MTHTIYLALVASALISARETVAQGYITFANRVGNSVNAPVTYPDGMPVGPEFTAQLYAGPRGAPLSSLTPQFPTSRFRDQPPESRGYFFAQTIMLTGLGADQGITAVVRAYNGANWETATWRGESGPVSLDAGFSDPPQPLLGLQPFTVYPVPEPEVRRLVFLGALLLVFRWNSRR